MRRTDPSFTMSIADPEAGAANLFILDREVRWWSQTGSNRRPHACKARALPTELWPHSEPHQESCRHTRSPARWRLPGLVGPGRLELPTLRLSGVRSNHLSYGPMAARRPNADPNGLRPTGLAIAPPDLAAGGEWKEKRRRRHPACF